ncbi:MAG: basic amino acid ABC transporter substrate-binding protein [Peptococcaceae bacterium]|nr:basic amino acid ABC transporter substrate-binding protein [Peptococcaceae bacterium]
MKNKKWIAMLLTAAMAVTLLAGCGGGSNDAASNSAAAEGSASSESSNVVVVGTNPTFAPFEYQDDEGNMTGFDLDLMQAIGEDQGFDVEFKSMEFDALIGALTTGQIDAIAAGMSFDPKRNNVLFSDPYMDASLGIMVAADSDITGADDLQGKTVAAQIGTTGADEATALEEAGTATAKLLDNYNTCVQDLLTGGCDAIIIDIPVAQSYLKDHADEVKLTGEPYASDYYGIVVDEDNQALLDKINAGLANVIENGKFDELCAKYELDVPESVKDGSAKDAVADIMSGAE